MTSKQPPPILKNFKYFPLISTELFLQFGTQELLLLLGYDQVYPNFSVKHDNIPKRFIASFWVFVGVLNPFTL